MGEYVSPHPPTLTDEYAAHPDCWADVTADWIEPA